jgi:hypothetical protein
LWIPAWAWAIAFAIALVLSRTPSDIRPVGWESFVCATTVYQTPTGPFGYVDASSSDRHGLLRLNLREQAGWGPERPILFFVFPPQMFQTVEYRIELVFESTSPTPLSQQQLDALLGGYLDFLNRNHPSLNSVLDSAHVASLRYQQSSSLATFVGTPTLSTVAWHSEVIRRWGPHAMIGSLAYLTTWPLGVLVGLLLLCPTRSERASDRRKRGICPHCRYDLKSRFIGVCPECGKDPKAD